VKSKAVREFIVGTFTKMWDLIKQHWKLAVAALLFILTGGLGAVIWLIVSHFNQIIRFVKALPGRIAHAAKDIWTFLINGIKNIGSKVVDALIWPFRKAFKWVKDHLPSIHIHHFGPIPIPSIHIPGLQHGGVVRQAGPVIVGEAGPEVLTLPRGAQVSPMGGGGFNPAHNSRIVQLLQQLVAQGEAQLAQGQSVQIDGRQVALAVARVGAVTRAMQ
jgi:hypothetical protein